MVGAGPAGLAAGAQAARRGLSHVVLERGELAQTVVKYQKGKHVMAEPGRLPLHPEHPLSFAAGSREEVLKGWAEATRTAGTNLRTGPEHEVTAIERSNGTFSVALKGGSRITCAKVLIAIGTQGDLRRFGVPGDDLPHVTYQLDDPAEHDGERIVVVGVGDAGIENALALAPANRVSVVNRAVEIDRAKEANKALLERGIAAGGIAYFTNARVKRFEPGCVVLATDDGELRLDADLVIGRLGALPPRQFLEATGIAFPSADRTAVPQLSATYETNVAGIYLIGAAAGYPLIKNCMNQGYEVVEHILGNPVEPADEGLLREVLAGLDGGVPEVLGKIQATIPLFHGLTTLQLREFLLDAGVVRRQAGETIFTRNQYGNSLYAILAGSVAFSIPLVDSDGGTDSTDASDREQVREKSVELEVGEFFGELSLIADRRHTGTAVAKDACVLIEGPRTAVNRLRKSVEAVGRAIDETFVVRRIRDLVGPEVAKEEVDALARAAEIRTFIAGKELFKEGDAPDGLHLIRRGSVMISCAQGNRQIVLAYIMGGHIVGEMALLAPGAQRSATARATKLTESVFIPRDAIVPFVEGHPGLRRRLQQLELERLRQNVTARQDQPSGDVVDFLIRTAGAGEATDILLIDEALCVRCNNCEKACAATHGGISRLDREAGPTFATIHVPTTCRHCENPLCMTDCPPDALRRSENGEVYITDQCIGCGNCQQNCPYGVIQMAVVETRPRFLSFLFGRGPEPEKKAVKCDLCKDLQHGRAGPGGGSWAACEASCPTGAVLRSNPKRIVERVRRTA